MSTNASADGLTPNNISSGRNRNSDTYLLLADNTDTEDAPPLLRGQHSTQASRTEMMDNAVGEWLW